MAVVSSMAWLAAGVPGDAADWGALAGFRAGWYGCLGRWADTLFELTDAVLCSGGPVTSLPRLSLEPVLRRGHGSAYAALADGQIDAGALSGLLAAHRPVGCAGGVRGGCDDLAAGGGGDLTGAGPVASPVAAHAGQAGGGGLVLPEGQPAELRS